MDEVEKFNTAIQIEGYYGYFVCNDGTVFSIKYGYPKILKPKVERVRQRSPFYERVDLYQDGKHHWIYVHKLVALAFLPPKPFEDAIVRHLDGNSLNNNDTNLAWGDRIDDSNDKWKYRYWQKKNEEKWGWLEDKVI